jgi:uridylate kinase
LRVVVRIGGSVIASPPNPELMQRYAEIVRNLRAHGHELAVIVGGGSPAREFIQLAKRVGLTEPEQDEAAISVSRLFAQLLAMRLGGLDWKVVPTSLEEAVRTLQERGMVVMGGLRPGMTTDTVAALVAAEVNADLIVKATDQDGVYTKDPRRYADAEKLDELSFDELGLLLEKGEHEVGIHQIIDPEAMRILKERRIETIIVNGFKPENLTAAVKGERIGTRIK